MTARDGLATLAIAVTLAAGAATVAAQGRGFREASGQRRADDPRFMAHNVPYDARVTFVRLAFNPSRARMGRAGGGGWFDGIDYFWDHDYPRADQHLTTIVRELTTMRPPDGSNVLWIGSPEIFRYPIGYVSEPGWWTQTDEEAANLGAFLRKGGFLIFDDFEGGFALGNLERELQRVLPGARLVEIPAAHAIFHSFFEIDPTKMESPYRVQPYFLGVFEDNDPAKRLMLIANYNNDIGESWEWSDQGVIPIDITNEAYKLGINYLVYALTH